MQTKDTKPKAAETLSKDNASNLHNTKDEGRKAYYICKRIFDIVFSFIGIIVLMPFMLIVAVIIKMDSKGHVLFRQARAGKNGKPFIMYKFRSMCDDAESQIKLLTSHNEKDGPIFKIHDDPRITRFGGIMRKTSIDELPQLLNILRGDMSFVGPRPPLLREVKQYTDYQHQRLNVKPGLTCYWQIYGRSKLSFDEWVELDLKYIRECGVKTDIKILLKTLPAVLKREGAY